MIPIRSKAYSALAAYRIAPIPERLLKVRVWRLMATSLFHSLKFPMAASSPLMIPRRATWSFILARYQPRNSA